MENEKQPKEASKDSIRVKYKTLLLNREDNLHFENV